MVKRTSHERLPTSPLPSLHPPLRETWRVSVPSESAILAAPIAVGGMTAVRCGNVMACFDASDGRLLWHRRLESEDLERRSLAVVPGAVVATSSESASPTLHAFDDMSGQERWRTALPQEPLETALTTWLDDVWLVTTDEEHDFSFLRQFHSGDGTMGRVVAAPRGANYPVAAGDRLFATSRAEGAGGLWVLERDGNEFRLLVDGAAAAAPAAASEVIAVTMRNASSHRVVCIDAPDLRERWSVPSVEYALAADDDHVIAIEPGGASGDRAALREAHSGHAVWTSPLESRPLHLFFSADSVGGVGDDGLCLWDRATGREMGFLEAEWRFSWGGAVLDGRIVLGDGNEVVCYASK